MRRVLLVWEQGSNLGRLDRLLLLGRELRRRGHRVQMLLRDLSRAHGRIMSEGFWVGQAPVWLPRLAHPPRLGNYAAVLVEAGWLDPEGLAGLLQGWRHALELLAPEVLVCDFAPTALLATRAAAGGPGAIPVWAIGTSFTVPPAQAAFPPFAFWDPAAAAQAPAWDAQVLASTNAALQRLGEPPLPRLPALFDHAHAALTTLPELAHHGQHPDAVPFCGPTWVGDKGAQPTWPAAPGPRVLAYLQPGHAAFAPLMKALTALRWPVLMHAKGLSAEATARLQAAGVAVSQAPLRMDEALAQCQFVLAHGGHGSAAAALLAGRPQLLVPTQVEQWMLARRLAAQGLAVVAEPGTAERTDWRALLQAAVAPERAQAAAAAAARHTGMSPGRAVATLADLIESTPAKSGATP